jgi:2-oxoglutarate ferredoxin oxidoreductase subunit gamma
VPGGAIIYDASLIDVAPTRQDVEVVAIPVTEIAERIGSPKVANMVAVGAFMGVTSLLGHDHLARVIRSMTKKDALVSLNLQAVEAGAAFVTALHQNESLWAV